MSELISTSTVVHSEHKTNALIAYILMTIGLFTAIPLLVGAVWAMLKKGEAKGSIYHSHLSNVTRVFWWSLLWCIVGAILFAVFIGYVIWLATWFWVLYRMVSGLAKILSDEVYAL